ncbi:MAG TPA: hypothetical protein VL961_05445 [Acidimicrobiales bacterium]|nr:hypothetical protein [Acidimicrobiales bacterium]
MNSLTRVARSFGRFWWDFLVGDTPEFFVSVLAIVAIAFAIRSVHVAAYLVLPSLTVIVLVASTLRGRKAGDVPDHEH